MPPVGQDGVVPLRRVQYGCEAGELEFFLILPHSLGEELGKVQPLQVHGQGAGGGLGGLHQVLGQLFQPLGFPVQHADVLQCPGVLDIGLFQQVHIVDDGGERGFQVVGHVGDELGPEALAFEPLVHRIVDGRAQVVELFGVLPQVVVHAGGVDLYLGGSSQNGAGGGADGLPLAHPPAQLPKHEALVYRDENDSGSGNSGAQQVEQEKTYCPPLHGPAGGERAALADYPCTRLPAQGAAQQRVGFEPHGGGEQQGQDRPAPHQAEKAQAHQYPEAESGLVDGIGDGVPGAEQDGKKQDPAGQTELIGKAVPPGEDDLPAAPPPPGPGAQPGQQEQSHGGGGQKEQGYGSEPGLKSLIVPHGLHKVIFHGKGNGHAGFQHQVGLMDAGILPGVILPQVLFRQIGVAVLIVGALGVLRSGGIRPAGICLAGHGVDDHHALRGVYVQDLVAPVVAVPDGLILCSHLLAPGD